MSFPIGTVVIWVPGVYLHIYIYTYPRFPQVHINIRTYIYIYIYVHVYSIQFKIDTISKMGRSLTHTLKLRTILGPIILWESHSKTCQLACQFPSCSEVFPQKMMPLASKNEPHPTQRKTAGCLSSRVYMNLFKAILARHPLIQDHHSKATFPWHLTIKNRMDLSTKNLKSYRSQEPFHKVSLWCAKLNWSFSRQQDPLRPPTASVLTESPQTLANVNPTYN